MIGELITNRDAARIMQVVADLASMILSEMGDELAARGAQERGWALSNQLGFMESFFSTRAGLRESRSALFLDSTSLPRARLERAASALAALLGKEDDARSIRADREAALSASTAQGPLLTPVCARCPFFACRQATTRQESTATENTKEKHDE